MADRSYQFGFREVEVFKGDMYSLGTGSYGRVCRAKCDGLTCAAKIMHSTLFDLRDPGTDTYLSRFEEECRLLSSARHPNVVQYLGTYRDPETHLPVLLMELCDESLCRFLERSPGPVGYHTQLNIAHDIALALVYLHQNSLTHRDLTGNNVLMIAGVRAKVTDFGMSRLANVNPRMKTLTLCPGNVNYMSPEALEEPPSYTDKLDVFSFGVLLVQIMTRRFPDPGPRFKFISMPGYPEARVLSPETERRASHLRLIADTHPLKAIALNCLKGKERERPTAWQLNSTLCVMKEAPDYRESVQQAQTRVRGEGEMDQLRAQVQDLQHQLSTQLEDIQQKDRLINEKQRESEQLRREHEQMATQTQQLQQQLQNLQHQFSTQLEQNQQMVREKEQLRREHEQMATRTQQLQQQLQNLQHQFSTQLKQNQQMVGEKEQLRKEHKQMATRTQQLQQQLQNLQHQFSTQSEQNQQMVWEKEQFRREHEQMATRTQQLQQQLQNLQHQFSTQSEQNQQMVREKGQLQVQSNEIAAQLRKQLHEQVLKGGREVLQVQSTLKEGEGTARDESCSAG